MRTFFSSRITWCQFAATFRPLTLYKMTIRVAIMSAGCDPLAYASMHASNGGVEVQEIELYQK